MPGYGTDATATVVRAFEPKGSVEYFARLFTRVVVVEPLAPYERRVCDDFRDKTFTRSPRRRARATSRSAQSSREERHRARTRSDDFRARCSA